MSLQEPAGESGDDARIRDLERAAAEFRQALNLVADALASTRDWRTMSSAALKHTAAYLQAGTAVFYQVVAGSERLRPTEVLVAGRSSEPVDAAGVTELAPGEGVAGEASRSGVQVVWPGTGNKPAPDEPAAGAGAAVAVPLKPGGHIFGVFAFYGGPGGRPFSAGRLENLAILVRQTETAIDRSFLYEEATRLSLTDGLTGLFNRRQFDLRLEAELSRAVRFSETFTIVMTDLDDFKPVNDTYGHQAGDTVLVEVASRLTGSVREVDLVARFGGDEFALLLPKTGLAGGLRLGEKMREAVSTEPFRLDEGSVSVSLSVGVAAYPEHGSSGKDLVAAADAALYRAKAEGGNRVAHARTGETLRGRL